jgi:hypothetical protein
MIPRHQQRKRKTASSSSFSPLYILLALVAFIALAPALVKADDDKKADYGTVIGIGAFLLPFQSLLSSHSRHRSRNNVSTPTSSTNSPELTTF